jgi:14-3-3 protein epsilon
MGERYEKQVYLAMLAEQCGRFEDMMQFLEEMVKGKLEDLSSDERNLLSIAYKNTISLRRTAIRTLLAYEMKEKKKEESLYLTYILDYKNKIEQELENLCVKIINNIDSFLLKKASTGEAKVFYHKMKADYFRYIAENIDENRLHNNTNESKKKYYSNESMKSYKEAMAEAATELSISNPIRLGLALNFSVFYYEVCSDQDTACKIAKETLDEARKELVNVDEDDEEHKDAFSIINLLQENLNMWISENEA